MQYKFIIHLQVLADLEKGLKIQVSNVYLLTSEINKLVKRYTKQTS
jgi:hypothetical protein